jgi:hypothetical protein
MTGASVFWGDMYPGRFLPELRYNSRGIVGSDVLCVFNVEDI